MTFQELPLAGAYLIEAPAHRDERGQFARLWDAEEARRHGLETRIAQCSLSRNTVAGTLRGLHFQAPPHAEAKLVICTAGAIYDVIVDIREESPMYLRWTAVELSATHPRALYVPPGFAHGFQTLADGSDVYYQISHDYVPDAARGLRWDDPELAIDWPPAATRVISERDRAFPLLAPSGPN